MLPILRFGCYGPLGPNDLDNSQPFISALHLLQEQGGLAIPLQGIAPPCSAFPEGPAQNTPPPPSPLVVVAWDSGFLTPSQHQSPTPSTTTVVPEEEFAALRALIPSPAQDPYCVTAAELEEILNSIPLLSQEEEAGIFHQLANVSPAHVQMHLLDTVHSTVHLVLSASDRGSHTPTQGPMETDPSPGHLDNPILISGSSQESQATDMRIASSFSSTPVLPVSDVLMSAPEFTEAMQAHVTSLLTEGGDYSQIAPIDLQQEAVDTMIGATNQLNQAVKGYSQYFLEQLLHLVVSPTFSIALELLHHMIDVVMVVVSMGAHNNLAVEHGEAWHSLMPGSWYCMSFALISSILRGCLCMPQITHHGQFDFMPCLDVFCFLNQLPMLETQCDALRFMAQQLLDHVDGLQGPLLPHNATMTV
jgi:hypothetical protein